jgi:hypothetical protein
VITFTLDHLLTVVVIKYEHLRGSSVNLLEYRDVPYHEVMCFHKRCPACVHDNLVIFLLQADLLDAVGGYLQLDGV